MLPSQVLVLHRESSLAKHRAPPEGATPVGLQVDGNYRGMVVRLQDKGGLGGRVVKVAWASVGLQGRCLYQQTGRRKR